MPTHQLAAVMFTDIVGYTAMMQTDREKGMGAVKAHEAILEDRLQYHGGELLQTMGDGSLSMFTSASAAIQCAKEIQEHLHGKVPLRIGLHVGEITREGKHNFGDGVNIASRIESMGIPGAVLFSKEMYDKIRNRPEFEVQSLGKFDFKNVSDAMEVFALANEGFPIPKPEEMKGKGKHLENREKFSDRKILVRGMVIGFVGLMIGVGAWLSLGAGKDEAKISTSNDLISIAVVSFENLSAGNPEENEFFCIGITDDIRTHLTKLQEISVARSTLINNQREALEKAKEEGINYVLQGNVRRIEDQVRVTVSLIQTDTKQQIWAENYDRELTGIFEIQSEIAISIASKLKIQLTDSEKEILQPFGTNNLEAYELFLRVMASRTETPEGRIALIEDLKEVIEMDSTFARAYAYLGETYALMASWWANNQYSEQDAYQLAKEAFQKAIRLNPYEESNYRKMISINMHYEWDYITAEKNIQKSQKLAPNYPGVWDYYQWLYTVQGKYEKSVFYGKKVVEAWKTYKWGQAHHGLTLFLHGQEERSKKNLLKLVEQDHQYPSGIWRLAQVYLAQDSTEKAQNVILEGIRNLYPQRPASFLATLGGSYAREGNWVKANSIIQEFLQRTSEGEDGLSFFIAMVYAGGENEAKTLEWLQKSYEKRDFEIVWLKAYPVFRFLHDHPKYHELLRKMNLE